MAKKKQKTTLTSQELRDLRSRLHHLKPVVIIGNNGLTSAVLQEINRALTDHELIKIRANAESRELLAQMVNAICEQCDAILIQTIGNILAVYRKNQQLEETN